jgi:tRNA (Thr-GGU) A37 N-methylase
VLEVLAVEDNTLRVRGIDMLDGTPILDIKPYVKRFDRIDSTRDGWQDAVGETEARRRGGRDRGK